MSDRHTEAAARREKVLAFIARYPLPLAELHPVIGGQLHTLKHDLQKLEEEGLAERRKQGATSVWHATPQARARNAVAARITPYKGQIVPSRTPPEFRELKRDPFRHAKLAMLTR